MSKFKDEIPLSWFMETLREEGATDPRVADDFEEWYQNKVFANEPDFPTGHTPAEWREALADYVEENGTD